MHKKPYLDASKLAIEKQLATAKGQLDAIAEQETKKAELTEVVATLEASLEPILKELDEIQAEADLKAEEAEKAKKAEADKAAKAAKKKADAETAKTGLQD